MYFQIAHTREKVGKNKKLFLLLLWIETKPHARFEKEKLFEKGLDLCCIWKVLDK